MSTQHEKRPTYTSVLEEVIGLLEARYPAMAPDDPGRKPIRAQRNALAERLARITGSSEYVVLEPDEAERTAETQDAPEPR